MALVLQDFGVPTTLQQMFFAGTTGTEGASGWSGQDLGMGPWLIHKIEARNKEVKSIVKQPIYTHLVVFFGSSFKRY